MAVAVKISAKKSAFRWRTGSRRLHLQYQHKPEPPPRARYEGCCRRGKPSCNQRDRAKDKDRKQTKAPLAAL
ncbi:hypothetical protein DOR57_15240 [Salmonella enterica subsp. salamae]|nr:hypothetical protein LFZ92_21445 [Salmonella enterica subsp. salamae serovar 57:z29:z42]ECC9152561.1 hypothetical protein [Salmonella enterica subsp. salamae]ECG0941267.1 hypothetical protein [Salmonella enterica subsp. salamae]ECJ4595658.1 hypothetical protein [Salmonella enterica subsp. salamae]